MAKTIKALAAPLSAILAALFLSSCGDSHEKVADDAVEQMDELYEIMMSVTDESSAVAATEKVQELKPEFEKLAARYKELGEPDEATVKKIEEKMKDYNSEMKQKFEAHMKSLSPAEQMKVGMILMGAMLELSKTMEDMPAFR